MNRGTLSLKVCGMREPGNIEEIAALGPAYMGFIFFMKSPRYVGSDFKIPGLPATVEKVGVFVNESTNEVLRLAALHHLDYVQLHGQETVTQVSEIRDKGVGVIKVFSVDDEFNFAVTKPYSGHADLFLFDTKGKYPGGNARRFNWEVLEKYDQSVPFFLSGGIGPNDIADAVKLGEYNLHGLDINSGVEIRPALKDAERVRQVLNELNKI